MIKRIGWISNSSSSSFIISKKDDNLKVMVEMDLTRCLDKTLKTTQEVTEYIISEFGWGDNILEDIVNEDDYAAQRYSDMLEAIKKGETVYILSGSSEDYDNGAGAYLYNNGLSGIQEINVIEDGD